MYLVPEKHVYKVALVNALTARLQSLIEELRARAGQPMEGIQEPPHLTILFLGHFNGQSVTAMQNAFASLRDRPLIVQLTGLGAFRQSDIVTNIHVVIQPHETILEAHALACEIAEQNHWTPQTRFVGTAFTPHLSLVDKAALDKETYERSVRTLDFRGPFGPETCADTYLLVREVLTTPDERAGNAGLASR